jgi:hypothetical protein
MFVPHRKHTYGPSRPVTGIALLLYMKMTFVPHREHTYGSPRCVTGTVLLLTFTFLRPEWQIWDFSNSEQHVESFWTGIFYSNTQRSDVWKICLYRRGKLYKICYAVCIFQNIWWMPNMFVKELSLTCVGRLEIPNPSILFLLLTTFT